jgi:hypothetical protein
LIAIGWSNLIRPKGRDPQGGIGPDLSEFAIPPTQPSKAKKEYQHDDPVSKPLQFDALDVFVHDSLYGVFQ